MTSKSPLLMCLLTGLICSVSWLPADEPAKPRKEKQAQRVNEEALLKRIEQLEQRVTALEAQVAQLSAQKPILIPGPRQIPVPPRQPDSPFLKGLPPQEINGIRYYHVPVEGRQRARF